MLFKPSAAGYSYGNSFAIRDKLNTDPNLTPNPNRPTSQKKLRPLGVSRTRDPGAKRYYSGYTNC